MADLDFSHMSKEERLDLMEALWDSLEAESVELTQPQARELDDRLAMLDANPAKSHDAFEILEDLRRRLG